MTTLNLSQFCGTTQYHRTFMFTPKLVHTDGVQYFAETAGCFWLLDIIATEIYPLTKKEPFLSIKFWVNGGEASIIAEDGDLNPVFVKGIEHTDCPEGTYEFFLTDNVLMLTSEY
jgi:hypothetical protein